MNLKFNNTMAPALAAAGSGRLTDARITAGLTLSQSPVRLNRNLQVTQCPPGRRRRLGSDSPSWAGVADRYDAVWR